MYSLTQRVLEIMSLALSGLLAGMGVLVVTSFIPILHQTPPPSSMPVISRFNMSMSPLVQLPAPQLYTYSGPAPLRDHIVFSFTTTADFSPAWDWNTKAIYVSLVARYRTDRHVSNEVTLLDTILHSREEAAQWRLDNVHKYPLEDAHADTLAGAVTRVVLRYQQLRYCGYSPVFEISPVGSIRKGIEFYLPSSYTRVNHQK